jgi:hypothetical protein
MFNKTNIYAKKIFKQKKVARHPLLKAVSGTRHSCKHEPLYIYTPDP